jgi:catechol 2,3-dioxygenase
MVTEPSTLTPPGPAATAADRIAYGAVHLDVCELPRSLAFWRDLIGLSVLDADGGEAQLGVGGRALVVLHAGAARPVGRGHAGLYHVAIHVPDATEFARVLVALSRGRVPQSPTDHIFSKATYVRDPDGIMLELTLETPERCRSIEITDNTIVLYDSDGRPRAGTEPLDIAAALAPLAREDVGVALAPGSYVGHVHLHVGDLAAAYAFYRDVVGFQEHALMASIGMADLSAGGAFPHRIAINDWHGRGARQAPAGTAGMRGFELILRGDGALDALAARAAAADSCTGLVPGVAADSRTGLVLTDPAGNRIVVSQAQR